MKLNIYIVIYFVCWFVVGLPIQAGNIALLSIPKCGTHLLLKTLRLLTGNTKPEAFPPGWCVIGDPVMKSFLANPVILRAHAIYIDANIQKLNNENIKTFFIYRDPRDQLISTISFMLKKNSRWSSLDFDLLLDELISHGALVWDGMFLFNAKETWQTLNGITEFYNLYLPWQFEPFVYTTTFEKLIGERGGGNKEDQLNEIIAIAKHLGQEISREEAIQIANKLFGGTATFHEGKIGSWKKHFKERHKIAFKKIAGQLLIDLGYEKDFNW